jgi:ribosomal-protein-alanine N-acetyltransferase
VRLRPIRLRDRRAWQRLRHDNVGWLTPWDATAPPAEETRPRTFSEMVRSLNRAARLGAALPFVIEYDGQVVGQLNVSNIVRGAAQFASIGYWIAESHAGRGIVTRAVAMAVDHLFFEVGLHRVEIAIRPENAASLRVVAKLGLTEVGYAPGYLHIDGEWRDHRLFAVTREEAPRGLEHRLDTA